MPDSSWLVLRRRGAEGWAIAEEVDMVREGVEGCSEREGSSQGRSRRGLSVIESEEIYPMGGEKGCRNCWQDERVLECR